MATQTTHTEQGQDTPAVTFTEAARERVTSFLESQGKAGMALRVAIQGRTSDGFRYAMGVVDESGRNPDDVEIDAGGFTAVVDPASLADLRGSTIDYVDTGAGGGLQINNPNPVWRDPLALRVQEIIDNQINPGVGSHGGWVELLGVRENKAFIRLGGGCQGCGMADVTLKQGIETMIFAGAPEITQVIDETDHAAGDNPYYRPAKGAA